MTRNARYGIQNARLSRRAFMISLAPAGFGLGGCMTGSVPPQEVQKLRETYQDEEHAFRLVNRAAFNPDLLPTTLTSPYKDPPGSIIVDSANTHLYFQMSDGMARRYGVGIGSEANDWHGACTLQIKKRWPNWYPTASMRAKYPHLPAMVEGGGMNPLGARALYLFRNGRDTLFRVHGTPSPWTIGQRLSSGCVRMTNEDVIELYSLVRTGVTVRKI